MTSPSGIIHNYALALFSPNKIPVAQAPKYPGLIQPCSDGEFSRRCMRISLYLYIGLAAAAAAARLEEFERNAIGCAYKRRVLPRRCAFFFFLFSFFLEFRLRGKFVEVDCFALREKFQFFPPLKHTIPNGIRLFRFTKINTCIIMIIIAV